MYWKQEKWAEAVKWYDKSLAEHRNPDIVSKKNEVCTYMYNIIPTFSDFMHVCVHVCVHYQSRVCVCVCMCKLSH